MEQKSNSSFPFFKFKNKETEVEIKRLISQYEGVLPEKVENYLSACHSIRMADLVVETKDYLKEFWKQHNKELSLTDFIGLINFTLLDIQMDMFKRGDNFIKMYNEARRKMMGIKGEK